MRDQLRYRRASRLRGAPAPPAPFAGAGQRLCDRAAGRDDAAGIRKHAERDDAGDLLGLREIGRNIFGNLTGD